MMKAPITLSAFAESLVRASRRKLWLTVLLTIVLAGGAVLGARLGERRPHKEACRPTELAASRSLCGSGVSSTNSAEPLAMSLSV